MNRERLEELLTGLLDGELSPEERVQVEHEIETSEQARALLDSYRRQSKELGDLGSLDVPSKLKKKTRDGIGSTTPIPIRPASSPNFVWVLGTVAACFLFFWMSSVVKPPAGHGKLYLSHEGLVVEPLDQTHQLYLKAGTDQTRALHSPQLRGVLTEGRALAVLECDAGRTTGQTLLLRLSLDLDGDDEFDVVQESQVLTLDSQLGYEILTADFPPFSEEHKGKIVRGKARLEFVGQSLTDSGLALQFTPDRAHLTLPLEKGREI
jgi:hypothetical protein